MVSVIREIIVVSILLINLLEVSEFGIKVKV